MTNEELVARLMQGDESALEELCEQNTGLIRDRANIIAKDYNCIRREKTGGLTSYSENILADLCGVGMVTFIERIRRGEYDSDKAKLTTYVVPYLDGAMRRHLESSLGNLALSNDDMTLVRDIQKRYHKDGKSIPEIAEAVDCSEAEVSRHLRYGTHFYGIIDAFHGSDENDESEFYSILEDTSTVSPALLVYLRIHREYLKELFNSLPRKDKDILGKFYGVFSYEKKPLEDIGKYHMIKPDAVEKAKKKALKKLQKNFSESRLRWWIRLNRQLNYPTPPTSDEVIQTWYPSDEWLVPKRLQQYVCALAEVYGIVHEELEKEHDSEE